MFCFRADQNYLCTYCIVCNVLMSQEVLWFEHFRFWVFRGFSKLTKLLPSVYIQALCQFLIKISFGFFTKKMLVQSTCVTKMNLMMISCHRVMSNTLNHSSPTELTLRRPAGPSRTFAKDVNWVFVPWFEHKLHNHIAGEVSIPFTLPGTTHPSFTNCNHRVGHKLVPPVEHVPGCNPTSFWQKLSFPPITVPIAIVVSWTMVSQHTVGDPARWVGRFVADQTLQATHNISSSY